LALPFFIFSIAAASRFCGNLLPSFASNIAPLGEFAAYASG
jgi:hypothetical protein